MGHAAQAAEKRRREGVVNQCVKRMMQAALIRVWNGWTHMVQEKKETRHRVRQVVVRWKRLELRCILDAWMDFVDDRQLCRRVMGKIIQRYTHGALSKGLVAWRHAHMGRVAQALEQERREGVVRRYLCRMKQTKVLHVWNGWHNAVCAAKQTRNRVRQVVERWRRHEMQSVYTAWVDFVDSRCLCRRVMGKLLGRYVHSNLAKGFVAWRELCHQWDMDNAKDTHREDVVARCLWHMQLRSVSRAWHSWSDMASRRVRLRHILTGLSRQAELKWRIGAFGCLRSYAEVAGRRRIVIARVQRLAKWRRIRRCFESISTFAGLSRRSKCVLSAFIKRSGGHRVTEAFHKWSRVHSLRIQSDLRYELSKLDDRILVVAAGHRAEYDVKLMKVVHSIRMWRQRRTLKAFWQEWISMVLVSQRDTMQSKIEHMTIEMTHLCRRLRKLQRKRVNFLSQAYKFNLTAEVAERKHVSRQRASKRGKHSGSTGRAKLSGATAEMIKQREAEWVGMNGPGGVTGDMMDISSSELDDYTDRDQGSAHVRTKARRRGRRSRSATGKGRVRPTSTAAAAEAAAGFDAAHGAVEWVDKAGFWEPHMVHMDGPRSKTRLLRSRPSEQGSPQQGSPHGDFREMKTAPAQLSVMHGNGIDMLDADATSLGNATWPSNRSGLLAADSGPSPSELRIIPPGSASTPEPMPLGNSPDGDATWDSIRAGAFSDIVGRMAQHDAHHDPHHDLRSGQFARSGGRLGMTGSTSPSPEVRKQ